MYRYIAYDDIEKNKWNGTVHYSPNGNVYGYHWYLKSVWREWGAIVEDDYESVLPIMPPRSATYHYDILPDLGPYSVNALTPKRVKAMLDEAAKYSDSSLYPVNRRVADSSIGYDVYTRTTHYQIDTIDDYDSIVESYSDHVKDTIAKLELDTVTISAGVKPEIIVDHSKINDGLKNGLLRIMYNAMHRGLGWSSAIMDKESKQYRSISFFISTHNKVYEIYNTTSGDSAYRILLLDLMLRNNAGKPNRIVTSWTPDITQNMGFDIVGNSLIRLQHDWWTSLRKWISR